MKITLLGCGTSVGVPALGGLGWGRCNPKNPKNRRQRSSVLIETNNSTILIDAGPDIRNQLLCANVNKIDAVLLTHAHSDHTSGLAELRPFYFAHKIKVPIFSNIETLNTVERQFDFLFTKKSGSPSYFIPPMTLNKIGLGTLEIGDLCIDVINQNHGNIDSLGFIFNKKFAYSTDVVKMPEVNFDKLSNLDLWIVEALRDEPHEAHAHFKQTFNWIKRANPKKAVLTHLGWESDYDYIVSICPENVYPGYDGMVVNI